MLFILGALLCGISLLVRLAGWCAPHQASGLSALGYALTGVGSFRAGHWTGTVVFAALCAWCAWEWWRGGGGDGTRRRLRRMRERFRAVRRTAPAAARWGNAPVG